ncbi:MAG: caiA, partial [Hyphomicrobiales bacterium]|nr:caiA [Hyphomicrobiales bacterium]
MDLQYSAEEKAFRAEVRAFIVENLSPELREGMLRGGYLIPEHVIAWQRLLHKKGWAVPHWTVEWGGAGWTAIQESIFTEELQRAPA